MRARFAIKIFRLIAVGSIIWICFFSLYHTFGPEVYAPISSRLSTYTSGNPQASLRKRHFSQVLRSIKEHAPTGQSSNEYYEDCARRDIAFWDDPSIFSTLSRDQLSKCLKVSPEEVSMLKETHKSYTSTLIDMVVPDGLYSGRGVVTIGGGKFTLLAYELVHVLRKTGTTLPVEILMPHGEDRDDVVCSELAGLNAKCVYFEDIFEPEILREFELRGYQYKAMSLLVSSFEEVIFLDSDNLPLLKLDDLFDDQLFVDTGFIMWPDYWRRRTHPVFYEISNLEVTNEPKRRGIDDVSPPPVYSSDIPLHDLQGAIPDASSESGQIMFNKKMHFKSVVLSLYYNVHGPAWYYPLMTQGTSGEGDKETFVAAAFHFGLPYYQVHRFPRSDGYTHGGSFTGCAIVQSDFRADYRQYLLAKEGLSHKPITGEYSSETFEKYFDEKLIPSLFMHANFPKFDPVKGMKMGYYTRDGEHFRMYTLGPMDYYNFDLEQYIWEIVHQGLCTRRLPFAYIKEQEATGYSVEEICEFVANRVTALLDTHNQYFPLDIGV